MGKTHLAVALCLQGIAGGYTAYFMRANDMMDRLTRASAEGNLRRRMRPLLSPRNLVINEFGTWPYDREAVGIFFNLVAARYERDTIILTPNRGFAEWGRSSATRR